MKKSKILKVSHTILAVICLFGIVKAQSNSKKLELQEGDIVFQASGSRQAPLLSLLTASEFTHCGVISIKNGKPFVIEAVSKVREIPLDQWVTKGKGKKYAVGRSKINLSKGDKKALILYARKQINKDYDFLFQWSDKTMYCSELVWKAYQNAGIEISKRKKFSDYPIEMAIAKSEIKKRYKNKIFNKNEVVVSPVDIYRSEKIKIIHQ